MVSKPLNYARNNALFDFLVPTGTPENVTALTLTSTSALVAWRPPSFDQQNGIIATYYINVTEVETGNSYQLMVAGATQLLINTLHPYYVYNIFISAATVIGQGPYSQMFTIQTLEDG